MLKPIVIVVGLLIAWAAVPVARQMKPAPATTIVLDTVKGAIEIELFAADAPKSAARLIELAKKGFYRGLRFHRVEASLVQVGDPQSRNVATEAYWGTVSSGTPIGVAEISSKHKHVRGAVGMAYAGGDARYADSQFYIMKSASPSLDGRYTIVGRVVSGMDVVDKLQKRDVLKNVTVKGAVPK